MDVPWYAILGTIGVIAWAAVAIVGAAGFSRRKTAEAKGAGPLADALKQNAEVNAAVLAKLDSIESRLGAVEKTLTDIPS